jgi:hypothetical protein
MGLGEPIAVPLGEVDRIEARHSENSARESRGSLQQQVGGTTNLSSSYSMTCGTGPYGMRVASGCPSGRERFSLVMRCTREVKLGGSLPD